MYDAGTFSVTSQPLAVKRPLTSTVILRVSWMLLAGVLIAVGGGCSLFQGARDYIEYNDATNDFVVGWRHYVWSNKAWHANRPYHLQESHLYDFGEGFRAGYRDVAAGGNGCPPPLPPRSYWTWKYQNPEGKGKIAAWFSGYPYGAKAAEEDCAGNWGQIPVSHVIEQQYSPEFTQGRIPRCNGDCFPQPTENSTPAGQVFPNEQLPSPQAGGSGLPLPTAMPTAYHAPLAAKGPDAVLPSSLAPTLPPSTSPTFTRFGPLPAGTGLNSP